MSIAEITTVFNALMVWFSPAITLFVAIAGAVIGIRWVLKIFMKG
jgi:hypothetical protein